MDHVKGGFRAGVKLVWMLCVPLCLLYFFCGQTLMAFFLKEPTALALESGRIFLKIVAPFYFIESVKLVADGILRGAGKMKQFIVATFAGLIVRVVLVKLLSATALGYVGIWLAWPLGWILGAVISVTFYTRWIRKAE